MQEILKQKRYGEGVSKVMRECVLIRNFSLMQSL